MRKRQTLWVLLAMGALGMCIGCGGGDSGQPGSSGFRDTGSQLSAQVTASDRNVDAFRNTDCNRDEDVTTDDVETFSDQLVTVTFTATTYRNPAAGGGVTGGTGTGSGSTLFLERYTIEYVPENPAAPPLRMREIFHTIVIPAPVDENTPEEVIEPGIVLADLQTKREFRETILGGIVADPSAFPTRYQVIYNFYGQNEFGLDVHVRLTTDATFGDFDNCGGA